MAHFRFAFQYANDKNEQKRDMAQIHGILADVFSPCAPADSPLQCEYKTALFIDKLRKKESVFVQRLVNTENIDVSTSAVLSKYREPFIKIATEVCNNDLSNKDVIAYVDCLVTLKNLKDWFNSLEK